MSKAFAILGNDVRLKCLYLAARHGEVCVCEVVDALAITQPTVSKAFKALKQAGFVADRRDGSWTHYRVSEHMPEWMTEIVEAAIGEIFVAGDYRALEERFVKSRMQKRNACRRG